ncbi:MAG TPA: site-2 protease family protein, partial [Pirellulaceae bacterium]
MSTFLVGVTHWVGIPQAATVSTAGNFRWMIVANWEQGLAYMVAVIGILLTHEMGHFIATLIYRIPASLPFFIPLPISPIGTMGAVIGMAGNRADRRQTFDVGIAGPLAGLAVILPVLWIGIEQLDLTQPRRGGFALDFPWLVRILIAWLRPELRDARDVWVSQLNPYFMAGWVGLLITGLNMLPVSQLDGGHVTYALLKRRAHFVARAFLLGAIFYCVWFEAYN